MDRLKLRETILRKIEKPVIPDKRYSVLEFGAQPDSSRIQTEAFQFAIDHISETGGGIVCVPAGKYLTGAITLRSRVELHLESADTLIQFVNEELEKHYPLVFSHWEATPCYNYSPLIYACDAHDIAVTGPGVFDGGADAAHWWNWHHQVENAWSEDLPDLQLEDRKLLRKMNQEGVAVEKRVFGPGHYLRPNFVQPIRCKRVLFEGFTLKHSPMWQLNPVMCESLTVDGVTLSSHGSNNDGCDPESCHGVYIRNCRFDTGDDCISLKSGRDRDGREANKACEYILIENNEFADGHGGIALGSEMSGGIRCVLAEFNRFSSPNLTYALRLKTNARRGGKVEDVILADSVMEHVHGAAVHGTMLYEDGRNGDDLPVFRNITIENVTAHGGDYGIFLEAFEEVPITGLILRNIRIDGAEQCMRSMNWKEPVIENVVINGKFFPRIGKLRIAGVPYKGASLKALAEFCGERTECSYCWEMKTTCGRWEQAGGEAVFTVPSDCTAVRVSARDAYGNCEYSREYRVLEYNKDPEEDTERARMICRGFLQTDDNTGEEQMLSRGALAKILLAFGSNHEGMEKNTAEESWVERAVRKGLLARAEDGGLHPERTVSRQEMATVAMQACGVNYRNASSTMPVCADSAEVSNNYGTNVARALYFGFMTLDEAGRFRPTAPVTMKETVRIINRVADFAGI